MTEAAVTVDELVVADPVEAWESAGFTVEPGGVCQVGSVRIRLIGAREHRGIVGWSLRHMPDDIHDLDGVPTTRSTSALTEVEATPPRHANGVISIDHVVLLSPDLSRTTEALAAIGLHPRREREGELGGAPVRQVFYRFGDVILEVVGSPVAASDGPSSLWGITFTVADIDATAVSLGEATSRIKDAVQPGRRITTLRHRDLGMSVRTALISPDVR